MDVDPEVLDPEVRSAGLYALASVSLGLISLCAAIVPFCGGLTSIAGVICGLVSLRVEKTRMAAAGVWFSSIGFLITVTYIIFLSIFKS